MESIGEHGIEILKKSHVDSDAVKPDTSEQNQEDSARTFGRTVLAVVRSLIRTVAKMETARDQGSCGEPKISIVHSYIPKNTAPPAEIHRVLGTTPANSAGIPSKKYICRRRLRGDK